MYRSFYFPDRIPYDSPSRAGLAYEKVTFYSADGTQLWGWFIPAAAADDNTSEPGKAKGTVIHMHGNAQNLTAHWQFAEWLPKRGFNLFEFDYRGFGRSQGQPDPKGIFEDAVAAISYLRNRPDIDPENLFIFGQSLGGMLAIAGAAANPRGIRAVLAEAPAHSYSAWMNDNIPGMGDMLDDTWTAAAYITRLAPIPLLLIHSREDMVVPYSHSVRLLAEAGETAKLITIEKGEHVDAMTECHGSLYRDAMTNFFLQNAKKHKTQPD